MTLSEIDFRPFLPDHLDAAVALSTEVGWPHRRDDWELVLRLGQGLVAVDGDRSVATVVAVDHCEVAAIGMLIVAPEARRRGLGRALMVGAMALAGERERRLVATAEGLPLYRSLGFVETGRVVQHDGPTPRNVPRSAAVTIAGAGDGAAIAALDRETYGADRRRMWTALATVAETTVLRRGSGVCGFAARRRFGRGEVIGPVAAATVDDAETLILDAVARCGADRVRVDVAGDDDLSARLVTAGLPPVGGGIVMRLGGGDRPRGAVTGFALASQSLG